MQIVSSILPSSLPASFTELTPLQSQVDGLVSGFVEQATDCRSLAAMMAGGMAYRLGRIGSMATGTRSLLSVGMGLGAEVTTFEITHRSLTSLTGESSLNPNLWRWGGQGGIRQGLLSSLITFGSLKGMGHLAQGENIVVQHLLQDTGMVLGHQVSGALGITSRPTESLAEQFLHAEVTNLQLGAGMALAHSVAPGIQGIERGLDLAVRGKEQASFPLFPSLQPTFALSGRGRPIVESSQGVNPRDHIFMAVNNDDGDGGEPSPPPLRLVEKASDSSLELSEEKTPVSPLTVQKILGQLHDRRHYTGQLLQMTLGNILHQIKRNDFSTSDHGKVRRWLDEVKTVQDQQNSELLDLRTELEKYVSQGILSETTADETLRKSESNYTLLLRVRKQLKQAQDLLRGSLNVPRLADLRRRLDWVLSLPEFQREQDFDWRRIPVSDLFSPSPIVTKAYERGLDLLIRLHPQVTQHDLDIYESAASGLISGWEIAFNLNKTLADTYERHIAQTELKVHPEKYDGVGFDSFVHQWGLMRIPFRGIQAMLLGLAAAGNRLSLYTTEHAEKTNLHTFFNDFPLMKVAFGLAPYEDPFQLVNADHIQRSPLIMDEIKRREFYERYFMSPEGMLFVEEVCKEAGVSPSSIEKILQSGKIPLSEFAFDILVDYLSVWGDEMQTLGFGRRLVEAPGSAEAIFDGLVEYFSNPLPSTTPRLRAWLNPRINPLTPPPPPGNLEPSGRRAGVITMEEAQLISISRKLKPHKDYLMGVNIDKDLVTRALSPTGSLHDKATVILDALLQEFRARGEYKFPDKHPHCSKLLEIIRASGPLKKEIQGILRTVNQDHEYNFLKTPLAAYFILG